MGHNRSGNNVGLNVKIGLSPPSVITLQLSNDPNVVIAKMDATANDVPSPYDVRGYVLVHQSVLTLHFLFLTRLAPIIKSLHG